MKGYVLQTVHKTEHEIKVSQEEAPKKHRKVKKSATRSLNRNSLDERR